MESRLEDELASLFSDVTELPKKEIQEVASEIVKDRDLGDETTPDKVEQFENLVKDAFKEERKFRDAMLKAMNGRQESEIPLGDNYWKLRNSYHQYLNSLKE